MKYLLVLSIYLFTFQAHAWVIERDFENGSVGQLAQGSDGFDSASDKSFYTNQKARSGNQSAISTITKGTDGFQDWGGVFNFPEKLGEGDEIWYRVWVYYPVGFDFHCGCSEGIKFMRIRTLSPDGQKFEGSWDYYLRHDGPVMATGVNSEEFYGNHPWPYEDIRGMAEPVTNGVWHAYEHYIRFSATSGKGIIRAWQDGKLIFEDKTTATLQSADSISKQATLWTYWNNKAPQTQSAYVDDVIITNVQPSDRDKNGYPYIGTGNATFAARPKPPVVSQ